MAETLLQKAQRLGIKPKATKQSIYSEPTKKKEGLFEKVAGFIAPSEKGLAETISSSITARPAAKTMQKQADTQIATTDKILAAYKAAPEGSTQKAQLLKIMQDRAKGIGTGFDPYLLERVAPAANKTYGQVVGEMGGTALDLYSAGLGQKAVQATKSVPGIIAGAKQGLIQGAKTGAGYGAAYGGLLGLQEGQTDIKDLATSTLVGGVGGGVVGGALGAGLGAISGKIESKTPEAITNKRIKALQSIEDNNSSLRRLTAKQKKQGINAKEILAQTDLLADSVDNTGTMRTQDAITDINDLIKPKEKEISSKLRAEGTKISLKKLEKSMINAVKNSELAGSAKTTALNTVKNEIKGLKLDADRAGNIPLYVIHNAKINKYRNINYLIPESKTADKLVARVLKEFVQDNAKTVDVKALNNELSKHFAVLAYLEKLDGRKVQGGKLGKYFAKTIGAVIGSHFGPLGSIIGAESAGKIQGTQMSSTFADRISGSKNRLKDFIQKNSIFKKLW